ncbi:hypothetical protein [Hanstruepera marina]|uniref:hypothetical protein n=1 Tax=Hanstruepera marina TaxID=2873265 RepID=UPI001CA6753E|nr:hypothetical protein [Hanstruepera marina]
MNENPQQPEIESPSEDIKLYSSRAISGATFLAGPLAGGYMVSENFKAINKPAEGRNALLIGILVTIAVFSVVFFVPQDILDKIPNILIPFAYTAIGMALVEWQMGDLLKNHKEENKPFYSGWRAAGIGLISLIITFIALFAGVFLLDNDEVYEQYDAQMEPFFRNESETLGFYDRMDTATRNDQLYELDSSTIPKWVENITIAKKANEIANLPPELIERNALLLDYAELRLETFKLFRKAIKEDTNIYFNNLDRLHQEIDVVINQINSLPY